MDFPPARLRLLAALAVLVVGLVALIDNTPDVVTLLGLACIFTAAGLALS